MNHQVTRAFGGLVFRVSAISIEEEEAAGVRRSVN